MIMNANSIFALLNIISAVLIIGISIPLVLRKIKMNYWYGIRIKESFISEDNWYIINEYGGKQMIIWSVPLFIAGISCLFIPISNAKGAWLLMIGIAPIIICMSIAIIRILKYARSL